jgi:hypothetical protein
MAHVERGRRGPSGRVRVADHPFDVVDDQDTGFGLPGGGEERGGDEIAGNNRDEMVSSHAMPRPRGRARPRSGRPRGSGAGHTVEIHGVSLPIRRKAAGSRESGRVRQLLSYRS